VPLLNPKFASEGPEDLCELRVRGTGARANSARMVAPGDVWVMLRK